ACVAMSSWSAYVCQHYEALGSGVGSQTFSANCPQHMEERNVQTSTQKYTQTSVDIQVEM
ncbi:hypothetical protein P7K49_018587, partial [Saguinus oedipus]